MKALLVRHAAAIPRGTPGILDDERPLTSSGAIRFRAAARGLARVAPRPDVLLTSPLPRAQATAEIAARAFKGIEPRIEPALADQGVEGIVAALKTHPHDATVALVGHEPMLGALLARMLGSMQAERLAFKKGGAALVDLADGPSAAGRLIWFLDPRTLRTLANRSKTARTSPAGNGNGLRGKKPS
jgi:phosphohistidine phosphatase